MEAVLALVGGTLLLLSFGGVLFESRILATKEPVPPGDRIAAALVGGALIAVATAVEVGKFSSVLWFGLAVNGAFVVG